MLAIFKILEDTLNIYLSAQKVETRNISLSFHVSMSKNR